jgi:cell wall-associated NlpC family hydrolase
VCTLILSPACRRKRNKGKKAQVSAQSKGEGKALSSSDIQKVIATARSYFGTPYRSGGVSRMGMDCSGLVVTSFNSISKKLPRQSKDQYSAGEPISQSRLKPGDLIFFADPKIGSGITHVGIVTEVLKDGNVRFCHASSSLGVKENLLNDSYFKKTYYGACRPRFSD